MWMAVWLITDHKRTGFLPFSLQEQLMRLHQFTDTVFADFKREEVTRASDSYPVPLRHYGAASVGAYGRCNITFESPKP